MANEKELYLLISVWVYFKLTWISVFTSNDKQRWHALNQKPLLRNKGQPKGINFLPSKIQLRYFQIKCLVFNKGRLGLHKLGTHPSLARPSLCNLSDSSSLWRITLSSISLSPLEALPISSLHLVSKTVLCTFWTSLTGLFVLSFPDVTESTLQIYVS